MVAREWNACLALALCVAAASGSAQSPAQERPQPGPAPEVKYEEIAPGVQAAQLLKTDELRGLIVEVKDFIIGPGKSAPEVPVAGFIVTELKSGAAETTIDNQTTKRRPGEFWVVRPGQKYAVKSLGEVAVLHAILFTQP